MREDIKEILSSFLAQVEKDNQTTNHFPSFYSGLQLKVGFGFGRTAKIPWITFLGKGQTPQDGIFPVYYFFKEHHKLILAYGISETNIPTKNWFVAPGTKTVAKYFNSFGIKPHKYGLSYVYEVYSTYKDLDWDKIQLDLDTLIDQYKKILQSNNLLSEGYY
jgi:5-methylcytosine-specific restriction protein B